MCYRGLVGDGKCHTYSLLHYITTGHSRTHIPIPKYTRTCLAYKYPILFVTEIHNNKVVCFDENQIDNPNALELPSQ